MKIILHKKQGIVFRSTSRFRVVAAGRRFGKTVMACVILFVNAIQNKDGIYWLVAPTYGQAKELAWNILLKMIPDELLSKKPNESDLKFTFKNGAEIHLKGADNPDTLVGRGLRGLVIDEVARIRNHQRVWEEILRPALTDYEGFCIFISTPQGKNYFWELFLKGQRKEDGFESWKFKTEDNPFIPRSEIKAAQATTNERYFRQEYEASFEDFTGLIWPEFDQKLHVIEPFEIPPWYEVIGIIDPALTGITGSLRIAIDDAGTLFVTNEFYEENKRVSEVSSVIKKWNPSQWFVDPAASHNTYIREGNLYSFADEYRDHGIYATSGENDVSGGINRVAEYFKRNRIKIFSNCRSLIDELLFYHWSEERETVHGITQPKPFKSRDHLCDCLRYGVMSRPHDALAPHPNIEEIVRDKSKDRAYLIPAMSAKEYSGFKIPR